jgi:hypothetical protein
MGRGCRPNVLGDDVGLGFGHDSYNRFLPAALVFFHLALAAAAIFARAAALILRRILAGLEAVGAVVPFTFAHRARWAAAILALAAADMCRFFGAFAAGGPEVSSWPPAIEAIWVSKDSICSLRATMRWSWLLVRLLRIDLFASMSLKVCTSNKFS